MPPLFRFEPGINRVGYGGSDEYNHFNLNHRGQLQMNLIWVRWNFTISNQIMVRNKKYFQMISV